MNGIEQVSIEVPMHDSISIPVPEEAIRERAHELYEQRGRQDGMDQEDWLQAESELRAEIRAHQQSWHSAE